MTWVIAFFAVFGIAVLLLVLQAKKAGPRQVPGADIDSGRTVVRVTAAEPGAGWQELGSKTRVDGINLRFDHNDDPQAQATLLVPERDRGGRNTFTHNLTVALTDTFETHHVHTAGYVFRVRLRGDAAVAGKEVKIQMKVSGDGKAYGGHIENDSGKRRAGAASKAAVGGWIEIEWAEVLQLRA